MVHPSHFLPSIPTLAKFHRILLPADHRRRTRQVPYPYVQGDRLCLNALQSELYRRLPILKEEKMKEMETKMRDRDKRKGIDVCVSKERESERVRKAKEL